MATNKRLYQSGWQLRLVGLWFASSLIIASISPQWTSAQSSDDSWAVPQNLSHSGATTNPAIINDSDGTLHVVWQDEFANFVYSQYVNDQWSAPARTSLHLLFRRPGSQADNRQSQESLYTGPNPLFIAGPGKYIHAVWLTPQGSLFASRVFNKDFKDVARWDHARLISVAVVSFNAAVDALGEMHVAYMRKVDATSNPAGIYYIRTTGNGSNWGGLKLLYQSPYFRTLESGEANLSMTTAGTVDAPLIFVAWDNRPRKQLLLAKSTDGGQNWETPKQIAGPTPSMGVGGPFNVHVSAKENHALLVWQSGQPGGVCTQFYGYSDDAGTTWSGSQMMNEDQPGCAQSNEFVPVPAASLGSSLFMLTDIRDQVYLSAWNGSQWSEPQLQPILSGFEDPEIYNQVSYHCLQAALSGDRLYVAGCDQGRGGDIWLTSRSVETVSSWFSPQVWNQITPIASDKLKVSGIELVATQDGLIHAFYSQRLDPSIYYTRWDGTTWSRFSQVLRLPDGEAGWPAVTAGPGDELFLIARSGMGSLYFSRAKSTEAVTPSGWSTPVRVQTPHDGKVSPADVAWDDAGTIYIAYSVPMNDERGVYLIQSEDLGKTWSGPHQVFNGAAAGFEFVGSPSLHVSADRRIDILWKQESIQADGSSQTLSLYFAHSEDAGLTFSEAERVVEAPVGWREMGVDSQGNLHLFWQRLDNMKSLWDQVSLDGGHSWQSPFKFPIEEGPAAVTTDPDGRLHLVESSLGDLNHWIWDGNRWQAEASAHWSLASQEYGPAELLATSVNVNGKMVIVVAASTGAGEAEEKLLFFATRTINFQPREIKIQETPAQVLTLPTDIPTGLSPTVESTLVSLPSPTDRTDSSDPISIVARVLIPVSLLLISVLGVVSFMAVRGRSR